MERSESMSFNERQLRELHLVNGQWEYARSFAWRGNTIIANANVSAGISCVVNNKQQVLIILKYCNIFEVSTKIPQPFVN